MTWTKVFANPEAGSSFDSLRRVTSKQIYLLAEPVEGKFAMYLSQDAGATWFIADDPGLEAEAGESAAMSSMSVQGPFLMFGTRGLASGSVHFTFSKCETGAAAGDCALGWGRAAVPMATVSNVGSRMVTSASGKSHVVEVAVGTAVALSPDGGEHWSVSPGSTRRVQQAVVYSGLAQRWISVGADGTQISKDDGRSWFVAKATGAVTAYDKDGTAVSLPFVVGKEGHVGVLRVAALE